MWNSHWSPSVIIGVEWTTANRHAHQGLILTHGTSVEPCGSSTPRPAPEQHRGISPFPCGSCKPWQHYPASCCQTVPSFSTLWVKGIGSSWSEHHLFTQDTTKGVVKLLDRVRASIIPTLDRGQLGYPDGHPAGPWGGVTSAALHS